MCLELELQGREVGRFLGAGEEMYDLGDMGPALRRIDVVSISLLGVFFSYSVDVKPKRI